MYFFRSEGRRLFVEDNAVPAQKGLGAAIENDQVQNQAYNRLGFSIHNYFIAIALDPRPSAPRRHCGFSHLPVHP